MRAGAAEQRQGDGGVRARHRPQPAGAQHRARQGRQVKGLSRSEAEVCARQVRPAARDQTESVVAT